MLNVRLADYDVILVNSSAGKDSQAMLDLVVEQAIAEGVKDRIVVVHADLGRVEWQGTKELAEAQAKHYDLRFEVVRREKGDLLTQVEQRGMWPDSKNRYCTSDQKRDQVAKLLTSLTAEVRATQHGVVTVLNCMGLRAEESTERAKKAPLTIDKRATNGKRVVTTWLPIFDWTEAQVWARIKASGVPYHFAYDLGMPRLSCVFCVFASKAALMIAGQHNPQLLDAYVAVEEKIGHTFTANLSIASVRAAIRSGAPAVQGKVGGWCQAA